jgi:hypothetical protein
VRRLRRLVLITAGVVMSAAPPLCAGALSREVDGLRVELTSRPSRPAAHGPVEYVVRLVDRTGQPVSGARLTLRGAMADGMSIAAPLRPAGEAGVYRGQVLFTMEGRWELTLRIAREGQRVELPLTEHVGR